MMREKSVYNQILDFDFYQSSEKEYGELVHSVIESIGVNDVDADKIFEVLKRKLTILENGVFGRVNNNAVIPKEGLGTIKDIIISDDIYFDCRSSLRKEVKRIIQNSAINTKITNERDVLILKYVFSHNNGAYERNVSCSSEDISTDSCELEREKDFYVIKHPNPDFNGCRTIALGKASDSANGENYSVQFSDLNPVSYVSSVNKVKSRWDATGRLVVNLMYSVLNVVPRSIKQYIAVLQDAYPLSQRNSIDSYLLYSRTLYYGIKLVPASTNILVGFLMDRLLSLESEVNTLNPNNYTSERYEKWRQEELHNLAIKIRKGECKDIISVKSYIQDDKMLKQEFSDKFTEEDINRNAQVIDLLIVELFEFVNQIRENIPGIRSNNRNSSDDSKSDHVSDLPVTYSIPTAYSFPSASRKISHNFIPNKRENGVLSSSDFESSAVEDLESTPSLGLQGKKQEHLHKQYVDLAGTILYVHETKILSLQTCNFVNIIPMYIISDKVDWCERYLQINFKKLFNPLETLTIRKTSVDYIISFILRHKTVSSFKFYVPCIKYLMQFLHEFVAHWNMKKANQNKSRFCNTTNPHREKAVTDIPSSKSGSLKSLFELYCHVVNSLCWLFSLISSQYIAWSLNYTNAEYCSTEDTLFILDVIFNPNRGFISLILFGPLNPLENIDSRTSFVFLKSSILFFNRVFQMNRDCDDFLRDSAPEEEESPKLEFKQYLSSLRQVKNSFENNMIRCELNSALRLSSSQVTSCSSNRFLNKTLLRHSGEYIGNIVIETNTLITILNDQLSSKFDINDLIDEVNLFKEKTQQVDSLSVFNSHSKDNNVAEFVENQGQNVNSSEFVSETDAKLQESLKKKRKRGAGGNKTIENAYGEMESSILPQQSLWELVWGHVPFLQEELERDLYITKNERPKFVHETCDAPKRREIPVNDNAHIHFDIKQSFSHKPSKSTSYPKKQSLLDSIISSEAYKRSKINMVALKRKNNTPKRILN